MNRSAVLMSLVLLCGCGKKEGASTAPSASASAPASPSASAPGPASARAAAPAAPSALSATYALAPAKLYIPEHKDYASVKQAKSDDASLVGSGKLTLSVAGDAVSGTIDDGPAKGAVIEGRVEDGRIRALVRRPSDALQGVLDVGTGKDGPPGEIHLSSADASLVRHGPVTLAAH